MHRHYSLIIPLILVALSVPVGWGTAEEPSSKETTGKTAQTVPPIPKPQGVAQPMAVDPELMRQVMQARSEYDELNRQIMERQTKLYEENPKIKELQTKMRDIQKQIDAVLQSDEELTRLKAKYKSLFTELPSMPKKEGSTNAPSVMPSVPKN